MPSIGDIVVLMISILMGFLCFSSRDVPYRTRPIISYITNV
jgi:hypothetical protein